MKRIGLLGLTLMVIFPGSSNSWLDPMQRVITITFTGSSPCSVGTRPLSQIPVKADCEFIKWRLVLQRDSKTNAPVNYQLSCVYGMSQPGTTGFVKGGNKIEMQGKWTIIKGANANPHAEVYQLQTSNPELPIRFLKLDDRILHLLDLEKHLMIGNAAWSYTLNKTAY